MKWFQLRFQVGDCQIPVSETGGEGRGGDYWPLDYVWYMYLEAQALISN